MLRRDLVDACTGKRFERLANRLQTRIRTKLGHHFGRQQKSGAIVSTASNASQARGLRYFLKLLDDVDFFWINGDGEIRRQCTWRCRPNGNACFVLEMAAGDREPDVNGSVVALLIFDLGFGERRLRAG